MSDTNDITEKSNTDKFIRSFTLISIFLLIIIVSVVLGYYSR